MPVSDVVLEIFKKRLFIICLFEHERNTIIIMIFLLCVEEIEHARKANQILKSIMKFCRMKMYIFLLLVEYQFWILQNAKESKALHLYFLHDLKIFERKFSSISDCVCFIEFLVHKRSYQ